MRRRPDPEALAATWTAALRRGETIVIEQSRLPAVRYLLLVIGMTVVCAWVLTRDGWWLRTGLMWLGIVLFGVVGIPVLVRQVVRGKEPVVRITGSTVSVGDEVIPLAEITAVRRHDGAYGDQAPEGPGGVSVLRGEEHALEIPLPPWVPTGAVERTLLPGPPAPGSR